MFCTHRCSYVKLSRNVYLTARREHVDREEAEAVCACAPASKCGDRCVNRAMLIEVRVRCMCVC